MFPKKVQESKVNFATYRYNVLSVPFALTRNASQELQQVAYATREPSAIQEFALDWSVLNLDLLAWETVAKSLPIAKAIMLPALKDFASHN